MKLKTMLFVLFGVIILMITIKSALAVSFNEIMYNPQGSDNNKEFIELYHKDWINLTNYIIQDNSSSDVLELIKYYNSSYSLIVEEGFEYNNINASIYSIGSTIGNGLKNSGEELYLFNKNNTLLDFIKYENIAKDGYSIELINNSWLKSTIQNGTPGFEMIISNVIINISEINNTNKTENLTKPKIDEINITNSSKIDDLTNESIINQTEDIIITEEINNTNLTNNQTSNNQTIETVIQEVKEQDYFYINLKTNKTLFLNKEKIQYKFKTNSKENNIEYWIEDLFGNIIKKSRNTTNTNYKSFTPSIKKNVEVYLIKAFSHGLKLSAEKMIVIKQENIIEVIVEETNTKTENKEQKSVEETKEKPKIEFNIISPPQKTELTEHLTSKIRIKSDDSEHVIIIKSIITKGKTIFSESFDEKIIIGANGITEIKLINNLPEMLPGKYEIKYYFLTDNEFSEEIKEKIELTEPKTKKESSNVKSKTKNTVKETKTSSETPKKTPVFQDKEENSEIYKSSSVISNDLLVYFFIALFTIICCVLIAFRK